MPRGRSDVVYRMTQSIARLQSNADIRQPCLTQVFALFHGFSVSHSALEVVVKALRVKDDLLWNWQTFGLPEPALKNNGHDDLKTWGRI